MPKCSGGYVFDTNALVRATRRSVWSRRIATVGEVAVGIGGGDVIDDGRERSLQRLFGSDCRGAQQLQIRRVRGQQEEAASRAFDQFPDLVCLVRGEIVQDHHLPGPERSNEHFAREGDKDRRIRGRLDRHTGNEPPEREPAQERQLRPVPGGNTPVRPLSHGRSSVEPRHRGGDPTLIDEDQILRANRRHLLPEVLARLDDVRAALFARPERLFFCG